jgi:hypothetical protein
MFSQQRQFKYQRPGILEILTPNVGSNVGSSVLVVADIEIILNLKNMRHG